MEPGKHPRWVERYRPRKLDEYVASPALIERLEGYLNNPDTLPNLILHSPAGRGKTSLAKLLAGELGAELLYVNAADETSVDMIRDRVKPFVMMASLAGLKIVILDEADRLSPSAQESLKVISEQHSAYCRFILSTNYPDKIEAAIQSRFQTIELPVPGVGMTGWRVAKILDAEQIAYDRQTVRAWVAACHPDLRKLIDSVQQASQGGRLQPPEAMTTGGDLVDLFLDASQPLFTRWWIIKRHCEAATFRPEAGYKRLFDQLDRFPTPHQLTIMVILGRYQYQHTAAPDKTLNWMACVSEILQNL